MYISSILVIVLFRLATGSFDHMIKIWSTDGKAMCVIACTAGVTGICYVPETRILWAAAGTHTPVLYEPKSGDNVRMYLYICILCPFVLSFVQLHTIIHMYTHYLS